MNARDARLIQTLQVLCNQSAGNIYVTNYDKFVRDTNGLTINTLAGLFASGKIGIELERDMQTYHIWINPVEKASHAS